MKKQKKNPPQKNSLSLQSHSKPTLGKPFSNLNEIVFFVEDKAQLITNTTPAAKPCGDSIPCFTGKVKTQIKGGVGKFKKGGESGASLLPESSSVLLNIQYMFLLCHSDLELNYILTKVFLWLLCLQLIFFPLLLWLKVIGIDCGWLWHLHSISSLKCCCGSVPVVSPAKLLQRYWMSCQCIGCPIQSASKLSAGSAGFNSLVPVMRKQSIFFIWAPCKQSTFLKCLWWQQRRIQH